MDKRTGGCHCKAVRYEVEIDLAKPAIECNCSHCQIKGLLLSYVPWTKVTMLSGEENLTLYRFNTEKIDHYFCATCGVQPFGRAIGKEGEAGCMINVRTMDEVDLAAITRMPFDGRSM